MRMRMRMRKRKRKRKRKMMRRRMRKKRMRKKRMRSSRREVKVKIRRRKPGVENVLKNVVVNHARINQNAGVNNNKILLFLVRVFGI
jgi:hypothetical protein